MAAELAGQIKHLYDAGDFQSIKYIISDQTVESIQRLCEYLPEQYARSLRQTFGSLADSDDNLELEEIKNKVMRNKKIDSHLQKQEDETDNKNDNFLEMISKINEKLIYQEHFGFPFYDLFKRILATHGDLHPLQQTIKTIHSQLQILYSSLFAEELLNWLQEKYTNFHEGMKAFLGHIFPIQCQKYNKFIHVYKRIKKETSDEPAENEDQQEGREMKLSEDETLDIDEKEFLIRISDLVAPEQFQQYERNRSYNFLCFGLKKYQSYIGFKSAVFSLLKQREFCELLSFLSIRFVRKIIFSIIRQKSQGKLECPKEPITSQDIKRVGNEIVDSFAPRIEQFTSPVRTIQQRAKELFVSQFEPYSYKDFVPNKFFAEASQKEVQVIEFVWKTSKEYKPIWIQRVKAQLYFNEGGAKPQVDYVNFIEQNRKKFQENSPQLWKSFIMSKFGFESEQKIAPRKRMKLDSLND